MLVKINLHTHESRFSYDSNTSASKMIDGYSGYGLVCMLGHDVKVSVRDSPVPTVSGIEHTVDDNIDLHVVSIPELDFKFLAHPRKTFGPQSKQNAMSVVKALELDGVEKFSNGIQQYEGHLPTIELANDDAHNALQIGSSFMTVEVNNPSKKEIMQKIKQGEIKLHNNSRSILGSIAKGAAVLT